MYAYVVNLRVNFKQPPTIELLRMYMACNACKNVTTMS